MCMCVYVYKTSSDFKRTKPSARRTPKRKRPQTPREFPQQRRRLRRRPFPHPGGWAYAYFYAYLLGIFLAATSLNC